MKPTHFKSAAAFRRWLEENHATARELLLGFHRKASGLGGLSYPEAVDELLCFGWIDGVKKRVDEQSYSHRVTPRRPGSIWSLVNVRHVDRLTKAGWMHPAGLRAFADRKAHKTGIYSYEQRSVPSRASSFPRALAHSFRRDRQAWAFWNSQPPGYRRISVRWVMSAKQAVTRSRRLDKLIALSSKHARLGGK